VLEGALRYGLTPNGGVICWRSEPLRFEMALPPPRFLPSGRPPPVPAVDLETPAWLVKAAAACGATWRLVPPVR
jgi:hypothetical protein